MIRQGTEKQIKRNCLYMIRELYKIPNLCKMKIIIRNTNRKNRKSSKSPASILILAHKRQISFSGTSPGFSSPSFQPSSMWYVPNFGYNSIVSAAQSCPTLCNPMDCRPLGSSVHGISRARILEWVAVPSSRRSSQLRDQTRVSCIVSGFFTI